MFFLSGMTSGGGGGSYRSRSWENSTSSNMRDRLSSRDTGIDELIDRQPNQKVPLNAFYLLFPNKLMYMVTIDGSQSLIASHIIIRKTCPDHSEE